jgi:hypothetical protein
MYRDYGCREIYSLDLIGGHQEKCQYIPQPCLINKLNLGTCTWTGISSKINSHLKQAHNNICIDYTNCGAYGNRDSFHSYGVPYGRRPYPSWGAYGNRRSLEINGVTPTTKHCKLIFAYDDVFYSCCEIKNGIFYSVLQYIGPAADAAKYQYKLRFFNKERTESLAITLLARSLDEDLSEIHNSGNCVKLYPAQFSRFVNERRELAFSMEIITVEKNYPYDDY